MRRLFGMALSLSLIFVAGAALAQYTDIDDIQVYTTAGAPDQTATHWGQIVTIRGIITCKAGTYNGGTHYIQDATGGIQFYQSGTGLLLGDEVEVTGTVSAFSGEIQVTTPSFSFNYIGTGTSPAPAVFTVGGLLADYENVGLLVSVTGNIPANYTGGRTFMLYSGTDSVTCYIDADTGIDYSGINPGDEYMVIGPCVNYNGLIEIKPRMQSDLVENPSGDTVPVIANVNCADWVVMADETVTVTADITDDGSVSSATLYYRDSTGDDDTGPFSTTTMVIDSGDSWVGTIPAGHTGSQIDFYISATDDAAQTVTNPASAPAIFFSTAVGFTTIYDFQYVHPDSTNHNNNFNDVCVTLQGIVTAGTGEAGANSKFIMQQATEGPAGWKWTGVLCYEGSASNYVFQGDHVEVAGRGDEYYNLTEIIPHNGSALNLVSFGNPLPPAVRVPAGILNDAVLTDGDGRMGEAYESVWIKSYDAVVTSINAYGEFTLCDAPGDTVTVDPMVTLSYTPTLGERIIVEGFMDYEYGAFQISPIADANIIVDLTGVGNQTPDLSFGRLESIYPNPFNPTANIRFVLEKGNKVQLNVYDLSGKLVKQLFTGDLPAHTYEMQWNGLNDGGEQVASGTYFARLRIGTKYFAVEKMNLVK